MDELIKEKQNLLEEKKFIKKKFQIFIQRNIKLFIPAFFEESLTKQELDNFFNSILFNIFKKVENDVLKGLLNYVERNEVDSEKLFYSSILLKTVENLSKRENSTDKASKNLLKINFNLPSNKIKVKLDKISNYYNNFLTFLDREVNFPEYNLISDEADLNSKTLEQKNSELLNEIFKEDLIVKIEADELILYQNLILIDVFFFNIKEKFKAEKFDTPEISPPICVKLFSLPLENDNVLKLKQEILRKFGEIRTNYKNYLNYVQEEFFSLFSFYELLFSLKEIEIIMAGKFYTQ